ncbi:U2_small nuclear ribonucleoprotein A' putative [Hexamita inflata]|uniref:Leucine-rich repeat-containing protein 51 n=1 Tax=Hexamita inflata TaxID=28002 RepID=A0ABP1HI03_9EUKA
MKSKMLTTQQYIAQTTPVLQIVNFDNFNVSEISELLPEDSNCKKRKPVSGGKKPSKELNQGLSFVQCNLINLKGLDQLMSAALWFPENLIYLNASNCKLTSIDGILSSPRLKTLLIQGNKLQSVKDLDPLKQLTELSSLSLTGNPVVLLSNYRIFMIVNHKNLKKLDGNPVTEAEMCLCANVEDIGAIVLRPPVLVREI